MACLGDAKCFPAHNAAGGTKGSFKLMTIGISGSGKSTFAKQMRIINDAMTSDEIDNYKLILFKNIMIGMQEIVKYTEKLEYPILSENRKHARFFLELLIVETDWDSKIAQKAKVLWSDPAIQKTWSEIPMHQFQISQLDYLINNIDRFIMPNFVPSVEDILFARQRTTGTQTTSFVAERYRWEVIDVGGQKPERQKWFDIISEGVDCVIFFTALDEFNTESVEEKDKTKMDLSLEIFADVMKHEPIHHVCCILFLNKIDLFSKKLQIQSNFVEFQRVFPTYEGSNDLDQACDHIKEIFLSRLPEIVDRDSLYVHKTCTLDTKAMNTIFEAVKDSIWKKRMEDAVRDHL